MKCLKCGYERPKRTKKKDIGDCCPLCHGPYEIKRQITLKVLASGSAVCVFIAILIFTLVPGFDFKDLFRNKSVPSAGDYRKAALERMEYKKRKTKAVQDKEQFEQSKRFEEYLIYVGWYLKRPKDQQPSMLNSYKRAFTAQQLVKKSPCNKGGTIEQCLNKIFAKANISDNNWNSFPHGDHLDENGNYISGDYLLIERSYFIGAKQTKYTWKVTNNGVVTAVNNNALLISQ
jgi:hypothetical protein